jgi:hypothetical protein
MILWRLLNVNKGFLKKSQRKRVFFLTAGFKKKNAAPKGAALE